MSTLEHLWAPAADAHGGWPSADTYPGVLVVAKTDLHGLDAAHELLRQAAGARIGACTCLGLLAIADQPGPLPRTLRLRLETVESLAGQAWRMPYLPALRTTRLADLPTWIPPRPTDPTTPAPPRRLGMKPKPAPDLVDPRVAALGADIFATARAAAGR